MYKIVIKKRAKKFIDKLPRNERIRVIKAIEMLLNGEDIKKYLPVDVARAVTKAYKERL